MTAAFGEAQVFREWKSVHVSKVIQHTVTRILGLSEALERPAENPDRATALVKRTPRGDVARPSAEATTSRALEADHERIAVAVRTPYFHVFGSAMELQGHQAPFAWSTRERNASVERRNGSIHGSSRRQIAFPRQAMANQQLGLFGPATCLDPVLENYRCEGVRRRRNAFLGIDWSYVCRFDQLPKRVVDCDTRRRLRRGSRVADESSWQARLSTIAQIRHANDSRIPQLISLFRFCSFDALSGNVTRRRKVQSAVPAMRH